MAAISEKTLRDVLQVRTNLEKMAFTLAYDRISAEDILKLEKLQQLFEQAVREGDILRMAEADENFHFVIYTAADNNKLREILGNLKESMYRYRLEYLRNPAFRSMLISEHCAMVASLRDRDRVQGLAVVEAHIANQEKAVMEKLRQEEAEKTHHPDRI